MTEASMRAQAEAAIMRLTRERHESIIAKDFEAASQAQQHIAKLRQHLNQTQTDSQFEIQAESADQAPKESWTSSLGEPFSTGSFNTIGASTKSPSWGVRVPTIGPSQHSDPRVGITKIL